MFAHLLLRMYIVSFDVLQSFGKCKATVGDKIVTFSLGKLHISYRSGLKITLGKDSRFRVTRSLQIEYYWINYRHILVLSAVLINEFSTY